MAVYTSPKLSCPSELNRTFSFNMTSNQTENATALDSSIWIDWAFTNVIMPTELSVGFVMQCLNLVVLHRYKIRTLTYTVYLRTLCTIYLIVIPLIAFSELHKAGWFKALAPHYSFVFFLAHFKIYLINTLVFSANLITTVLAAETLRGLTNPFQSLRGDGTMRSVVIIIGSLSLVSLILLPIAFQNSVQGPDVFNNYCVARGKESDLDKLSNILVPIFESGLVIILMGMYGALFIKYRLIMQESREIAANFRSTAADNGRHHMSKHHKAIGICLGSIGAYVISNLPSALKEIVNMVNSAALEEFKKQSSYKVMVKFCNIALFLNFTLIVLLQVLTSLQYRECLFRLFSCCCAQYRSPLATQNGKWRSYSATTTNNGTRARMSLDRTRCKTLQQRPLLRQTNGRCTLIELKLNKTDRPPIEISSERLIGNNCDGASSFDPASPQTSNTSPKLDNAHQIKNNLLHHGKNGAKNQSRVAFNEESAL